jgi:hypothetical protein
MSRNRRFGKTMAMIVPPLPWHFRIVALLEAAMLDSLKDRFTRHPHALEETYGEHFGHAMGYAGRLFKASFCAFSHALFPFLFEKTASNEIKAMYAEMTARGATAPVTREAQPLPAE